MCILLDMIVNDLKQIMVLTKNSLDAIFVQAKLLVQQLKSICKFLSFSQVLSKLHKNVKTIQLWSSVFRLNRGSPMDVISSMATMAMDVISGMATMAMAIPTISFGHRSGHFWPQIRPQLAKISQIWALLVIWPYLQYPYYYVPVYDTYILFLFCFIIDVKNYENTVRKQCHLWTK